VLLNKFNFLNKNRKLAPKFLGPFKILRVKGPHNIELLLTNGGKIVVYVARVKQYFSPETTSCLSPNSHEEFINTRSLNNDVISSEDVKDFQPPSLTPSHTRKPGRPASKKVLPPSDVSFSKKGREKDRGVGENTDNVKNETKNKLTQNTDDVYANAHHMTTRAAAKRRHTDVQVTDSPIESTEMDDSDNIATLSTYSKLNNIIKWTYQCGTNKNKKLLHNSRMDQLQEDLDTFKYSDYPESGISPQQHAPPAAAGQPAAPTAAAAAAAAAVRVPVPAAATAPASGGVPLLAPAPAGPIPPAAPPGPLLFATAAAIPADFVLFDIPAEWQDLCPTTTSMPVQTSTTTPRTTGLLLERTVFGWRESPSGQLPQSCGE
jgi:hypothetical protein